MAKRQIIHGSVLVTHVLLNSTTWRANHVLRFSVARNNDLNQCWVIVNWTLRNKLHWNQTTKCFIQKNAPAISFAKWRPFCPGGDELNTRNGIYWYVLTTQCVFIMELILQPIWMSHFYVLNIQEYWFGRSHGMPFVIIAANTQTPYYGQFNSTTADWNIVFEIANQLIQNAWFDICGPKGFRWNHYNDAIMGTMASQIASLTIVYSNVYFGTD